MGGVDLDLAADVVAPLHLRLAELEAPVRPAALLLQFRTLLIGELERSAVIDRRLVHRELALAAAVEFGSGFISRIERPACLQLFCRSLMRIGALDLPREKVMAETEPRKVLDDRRLVFGLRALGIGVVDAQKELAAGLVRE